MSCELDENPQDAARSSKAGSRVPVFDAFRRYGGRWIDSVPAPILQPDLAPGMRIGLAHNQVPAQRIHLATLITHHDARRNSGAAHHVGKRGGIVLAETLAGLEQEAVDRITAERGWLQRVVELLLIEHAHYGLDESRVRAGGGSHFLRQLCSAFIAGVGQLQVPIVRPALIVQQSEISVRLDPIGDALLDRRDMP